MFIKSVLRPLVLLVVLGGCSKDEFSYSYNVTAVNNGSPVQAKIIAIIDGTSEIIVTCDSKGEATIRSLVPVKQLCCVSFGKSGVIDIEGDGDFIVEMQALGKLSPLKLGIVITAQRFWGVGDKDVVFKYSGNFYEYHYMSWLPYLSTSIDPNDWIDEDVVEWLPEWKGKKLYVPQRYQVYHQEAYGDVASNSLFLLSVY